MRCFTIAGRSYTCQKLPIRCPRSEPATDRAELVRCLHAEGIATPCFAKSFDFEATSRRRRDKESERLRTRRIDQSPIQEYTDGYDIGVSICCRRSKIQPFIARRLKHSVCCKVRPLLPCANFRVAIGITIVPEWNQRSFFTTADMMERRRSNVVFLAPFVGMNRPIPPEQLRLPLSKQHGTRPDPLTRSGCDQIISLLVTSIERLADLGRMLL
jgi:hypothetical protein